AASIAHEVNQSLAGIVTNASASLRWLAGEMPDLNEAREAVRRIIRDGNRAGDVISRMRALFKKARTAKERLDINEAIEEVVILAQSELQRNKVSLRTELAATLPPSGRPSPTTAGDAEPDPERHRSHEHSGGPCTRTSHY